MRMITNHNTSKEVGHKCIGTIITRIWINKGWGDTPLLQLTDTWDTDRLLGGRDMLGLSVIISFQIISLDIKMDLFLWLSNKLCMMKKTILLKEKLLRLRNKIIRNLVKLRRGMLLVLKLWEMMKLKKMISLKIDKNLDLWRKSIQKRVCIKRRVSMLINECNIIKLQIIITKKSTSTKCRLQITAIQWSMLHNKIAQSNSMHQFNILLKNTQQPIKLAK